MQIWYIDFGSSWQTVSNNFEYYSCYCQACKLLTGVVEFEIEDYWAARCPLPIEEGTIIRWRSLSNLYSRIMDSNCRLIIVDDKGKISLQMKVVK